jgi:hypothetical protein
LYTPLMSIFSRERCVRAAVLIPLAWDGISSASMEQIRRKGLWGAGSGNLLALFFFNLGPHEPGPVDTLRLEEIMGSTQNFERRLLVTSINRKRPRMLDLESRSRATPRAIF